MMNLVKLMQTFISKLISIVVAIVGLTYTGIRWHQNELEAVEFKVITQVKEMRRNDMEFLNTQLNDIKKDTTIIKEALIKDRR